MARKFSVEFIDRLLNGNEYDQLVQLSNFMCSSSKFSRSADDYGFPAAAFVFVEALCWFAQGIRSGSVWTYFEATPPSRQSAMANALREFAPDRFAAWYERGMTDWQDQEKIDAVDRWLVANDELATAWLRKLAVENRATLLDLTE